MMLRSFITLMTALFLVCHPFLLSAEITGKVDVGPVLLKVDVLESGKTIDKMHMRGVKADATIVVWNGIFLKPNIIWATGDGHLTTGSIGIGQAFPVTDCLLLMPSVGYAFSHLQTTIDLDLDFITLDDLTEKFRSSSAYIALEFTYKITPCWTLMGMYQYAWSGTLTTIKSRDSLIDFSHSDKSHSQGPNYSLGIDYSLNPNWSITFGVGYNISLSKEKHGLRATGAKLGLAYYF